MGRKFVVAVTSSFTLCFLLSISEYISVERHLDTYYPSFFELMYIYLMFATPVYVLGGIPVSVK